MDRQKFISLQLTEARIELELFDVRNGSITDPTHARAVINHYRRLLFLARTAVDEQLHLQLKPSDDDVVRQLSERVYNLEERTSEIMSSVTTLAGLVTSLSAAEAAAKIREQGIVAVLQASIKTLNDQIKTLTTNDTDPATLAKIQSVINDLNTVAVAGSNPSIDTLEFAGTPPIGVDADGATLYLHTGVDAIDPSQYKLSGVYGDPTGASDDGEALYTFIGDSAPGQVNGVSPSWATVPQPAPAVQTSGGTTTPAAQTSGGTVSTGSTSGSTGASVGQTDLGTQPGQTSGSDVTTTGNASAAAAINGTNPAVAATNNGSTADGSSPADNPAANPGVDGTATGLTPGGPVSTTPQH